VVVPEILREIISAGVARASASAAASVGDVDHALLQEVAQEVTEMLLGRALSTSLGGGVSSISRSAVAPDRGQPAVYLARADRGVRKWPFGDSEAEEQAVAASSVSLEDTAELAQGQRQEQPEMGRAVAHELLETWLRGL
jgi:SRSO17 transposase